MKKIVTLAAVAALTTLAACSKEAAPTADATATAEATDAANEVANEVAPEVGGGKPAEGVHEQAK
jgi:protein involved in sex pheromone biosynthesis